MDEVTKIILTSSVVSSLLSAVISWAITSRTSKVNYKNEYYKKLLDRRIAAYEEVEALVSSLTGMVQAGNGQLCPLFCHLGSEHFHTHVISISANTRRSFWLSDEVSGKITEYNVFLLNAFTNKINNDEDEESQAAKLVQLGIKHVNDIRRFRKDLQKLLYRDLNGLHDIESFVKVGRSPGTYKIWDPEN